MILVQGSSSTPTTQPCRNTIPLPSKPRIYTGLNAVTAVAVGVEIGAGAGVETEAEAKVEAEAGVGIEARIVIMLVSIAQRKEFEQVARVLPATVDLTGVPLKIGGHIGLTAIETGIETGMADSLITDTTTAGAIGISPHGAGMR